MQPVLNPTDEHLLRLLKEGDEDSFTALYRRWSLRIYRFAWQMSGSPQTAEEVTQDVFMALVQNIHVFDAARGSLLSFLYGIARNLLRRHFEQEGNTEAFTACEGSAEEQASGSDLLGDLTRRENIEAVRQAVLSLPPVYREVLIFCDLQEWSYEQAAAVLGCPVGTVRSRLHRGRTALAAKLQNRCCV